MLPELLGGLLAGTRLRHHQHVSLGIDHGCHSQTCHGMVVHDHHSDSFLLAHAISPLAARLDAPLVCGTVRGTASGTATSRWVPSPGPLRKTNFPPRCSMRSRMPMMP